MLFSVDASSAQSPIASPAIDETLFKDGAIQSHELHSGQWYAKCQEIVKVKRRICNLLASVSSRHGGPNGSILIATTDTGVPAVMIALPMGATQGQSIAVKSSNIGKVDGKVVKVEFSTVVPSSQCEATCKYMFPLDPRLVFILNAGEPASVFLQDKNQDATIKKKKKKADAVALYSIPGDGFADTLKASTEAW